MNIRGTLYGIGLGPGDPELITLKAVKLLNGMSHVFVPKARGSESGLASVIAAPYLRDDAIVIDLEFPMKRDELEVKRQWKKNCDLICSLLDSGKDAAFVTLGDPTVFSTYLYLLEALGERTSGFNSITVPGISAFSAAASLTNFPLGYSDMPLTVLPAAEDPDCIAKSLQSGGVFVFMKIGRRLKSVLAGIEKTKDVRRISFVGRAGLNGQIVLTDLNEIKKLDEKSGNLSVLLVQVDATGKI